MDRMTIDEEINRLEQTALEQDELAKRYESDSYPFDDSNERIEGCKRYAKRNRRLAAWLKELEGLRAEKPDGSKEEDLRELTRRVNNHSERLEDLEELCDKVARVFGGTV